MNNVRHENHNIASSSTAPVYSSLFIDNEKKSHLCDVSLNKKEKLFPSRMNLKNKRMFCHQIGSTVIRVKYLEDFLLKYSYSADF